MCPAFFNQIDDDQQDQVGSIAAHLPRHVRIDGVFDGRHVSAQIDYDQRVGLDPAEHEIVGSYPGYPEHEIVGSYPGYPEHEIVGSYPGVPEFEIVGAAAAPARKVVVSVGRAQNVRTPRHASLDLNVNGRHLTAQIDYDQRVSGDWRDYEIVGEDPDFPPHAAVSGWFNSLAKKVGITKAAKKITGAKSISFNNPTAKSLAKDVAHTAVIGVKIASIVVPGLSLASAAGSAIGGAGKAASAARTVSSTARSAAGSADAIRRAAVHVAGAHVAADKLVAAAERGGTAARTASRVVRQTTALAARGNPDAKAAVQVLNNVATQRRAAAIPKGQEQPVTPKGAEALRAFAAAPKLTSHLTEKPPAKGRRGWFISTEPESYGRIDFSGGISGRWSPV
jgi:hypothetical protein